MYPKWVQRAPHIGAVLCLNKDEEEKLLEDYQLEQLAQAEEAMKEAQATAESAKEAAQVALKTKGK